MYFVDYNGEVYSDGGFFSNNLADAIAIKNHRAFKTKKIAELFADKTQIIADQLYFKELFDKDISRIGATRKTINHIYFSQLKAIRTKLPREQL